MTFNLLYYQYLQEKATEKLLGVNKNEYQLFALVPLTDELLNSKDQSNVVSQNPEIAIRLTQSDLNLQSVNDILSSKDKYKQIMQKTSEALLAYSEELKRMKRFLLETGGASGNVVDLEDEANKESVVKKAMQSKQIQEENKKLRKLIKTQLENSENLRMETQTTIETLREEFDLLVKELAKYKKKDGSAAAYLGNSAGDNQGSSPQQFQQYNSGGAMNINQFETQNQGKTSESKNRRDLSNNQANNAGQQKGSSGVPKLKLGKQ
eukprot:403359312